MKTALRSILIILIEIAAIAALIFGCVQLFPKEGEVVVDEEALKAGEEGNIGGNAGAALEAGDDAKEESSEEADAEDAEAEDGENQEVPSEAPAE